MNFIISPNLCLNRASSSSNSFPNLPRFPFMRLLLLFLRISQKLLLLFVFFLSVSGGFCGAGDLMPQSISNNEDIQLLMAVFSALPSPLQLKNFPIFLIKVEFIISFLLGCC
jgi:hypothetical protein